MSRTTTEPWLPALGPGHAEPPSDRLARARASLVRLSGHNAEPFHLDDTPPLAGPGNPATTVAAIMIVVLGLLGSTTLVWTWAAPAGWPGSSPWWARQGVTTCEATGMWPAVVRTADRLGLDGSWGRADHRAGCIVQRVGDPDPATGTPGTPGQTTTANLPDDAALVELPSGSVYDLDAQREILPDGAGTVRIDNPPTRDQVRTMGIGDTSHRLAIPTIGINSRLLAMNTYQSGGQTVINPPTSDNPYLVRDWDSTADPRAAMTVVAMHAIYQYRSLPGTRLSNAVTGGTLTPGQSIFLDNHTYVVDRTRYIDKNHLGTADDLWDSPGGTLVLITCLQTGGRSTQNLVVTAHLIT